MRLHVAVQHRLRLEGHLAFAAFVVPLMGMDLCVLFHSNAIFEFFPADLATVGLHVLVFLQVQRQAVLSFKCPTALLAFVRFGTCFHFKGLSMELLFNWRSIINTRN